GASAAPDPAAAPEPVSGAASVAGEFVMLQAGTEVLRVRLEEAGGSTVEGTLVLMGTPFPVTGTGGNGHVSFTTESRDGAVGQWEGRVDGDRLSLTLTTASGAERYEL